MLFKDLFRKNELRHRIFYVFITVAKNNRERRKQEANSTEEVCFSPTGPYNLTL